MSKIQKDYLIFDIEVFPHWWCIVFSDLNGFMFHYSSDDPDYLLKLSPVVFSHILVGFNIKYYDMKILHAIIRKETPERIYTLSKNLIEERFDVLDSIDFWNKYLFTDLFDDWKNGSLKEFESNKGMNIKESSLSFDQEILTDEDKQETLKYCYHDVKATLVLYKEREEYLNAKLELAELFNINSFKALKSTNAKLASMILKAEFVERTECVDYVIPDKAKQYITEHIPKEILEMFKVLSNDEKKVYLYDNEIVFGIGGIHSTYSQNIKTKTDDEYQLINVDVTSYYPNLLMHYNYMSRNVPNANLYKEIYDMRRKLKKEASEEKNTNGKTENYQKLQSAQTGLKLILNTVYGAMKNKYNALYDPYMAGSLCYTGQLLLAALANNLHKKIKNIKIIQTNTDGILVKCPKNSIDTLKLLVYEWEKMNGFTMEYDYIEAFFQRDVNNYIEVTGNPNDPYKLKGKWSNQAFIKDVETNLNAPIVHFAMLNYYTKGIPIEWTILGCFDPLQFCFTAKRGRTYSETCYELNGEFVEANKVNRVVATTDKTKGSLYKYKPYTDEDEIEDLDGLSVKELKKKKLYAKKAAQFMTKYKRPFGRMDKIAEIPEHCELMNEDPVMISTLDKQWYIDFCKNKMKGLSDV